MKILFLTPRLPYPPLKGDQVVAYNRLRTLGVRHEITLLTFVDGKEPAEAEEALRPYCKRIIRIHHPLWRVGWNLISRGLWSRVPFQVLYYWSPAFQKALTDLLSTEQFDVVHAFLLRLLPYLEGIPVPVVLEGIDSMRLNLSRQVAISRGWRRWLYLEEKRRMDGYESTAQEYVDSMIFVSELDAINSGCPEAIWLMNGVEIPEKNSNCDGEIVAFSGNMGYLPNIQAVNWFVENCWFDIRTKHPKARFKIIGDGSDKLRHLKKIPGIELAGRVSNMAETLNKAAVVVAPMQSGSGIQNKVLEAMACGLPVVASTLGLGPLGAENGNDIYLADTPADVVRAVTKLLENPDLRKSIGKQGRNHVAQNHSWGSAAERIESEWKRLQGYP